MGSRDGDGAPEAVPEKSVAAAEEPLEDEVQERTIDTAASGAERSGGAQTHRDQREAALKEKASRGPLTEQEKKEWGELLFDEEPVMTGGKFLSITLATPIVKGNAIENMYTSFPLIISTDCAIFSLATKFRRRGRYIWLIEIRYSEFRKVHAQLDDILRRNKAPPLPEFPPKVRMMRFKDETVDFRRSEFAKIFNAIVKDEKLYSTEFFVRFLWPRDSMEVYRPLLESCVLEMTSGNAARDVAKENAKNALKETTMKSGCKLLGHPIPFVGGVVDGAFEFKDNHQVGRATAVGVGSATGGIVGAGFGMGVGSMIFPSVGSVVGHFVGGSIGSTVGSFLGKHAVPVEEPEKTIPATPFDQNKGQPKTYQTFHK